jgi:hypothetical protein
MVFRNEEARAKALAAAPEAEAWERAQPEYIEAETYVRAMGHEGFAYVAALYDQLEEGNMLTPQQVERVQRSRKADIRATALAYRAAKRAEAKAGKYADLNRIHIGTDIRAGDYAVEDGGTLYHLRVERPSRGILSGFTVIYHLIGEGVTKAGVQYPGERTVQYYQGALAHLVSALVADPVAARERYEEVA